MRIVYVAHGHPKYSKGGAEVACYNLFKAAVELGHDAFFVARASSSQMTGHKLNQMTANEYLIAGETPDYFYLQSGDKLATDTFEKLLILLRPDVVHFHHFVHMGLDWLALAKSSVPGASAILTLHEYYAICANNGQMVELGTNKLCYGASPTKCSACMGRSSDQLFFRELLFKGAFSRIDHYISPSLFLKERYIAWGLNESQISIIENGLDLSLYKLPEQAPPQPQSTRKHINFAYFGQMTQFKGVDILLDALSMLPEDILAKCKLNIHGANLDILSSDLKESLLNKIKRLSDAVNFRGKYESEEFSSLACQADFMIMPSRWWENSPVVIQEAKACKIPIIVSDIGGMREKVRPGENGLWFKANSPESLAKLLRELVEDSGKFSFKIANPLSHIESFRQHLSFYEKQVVSR